MNFYDVERFAQYHTTRLHKEAAVAAVVRALGAGNAGQGIARALRRLAERLDDGGLTPATPAFDVTQPLVSLARRAA